MSTVRQWILKPIGRPGLLAGLDGNVSDGVTLTKLSLDKVAEADLNWMLPNDPTVNLQGWLTRGLDDLFADLLTLIPKCSF